jgi:hypothetical protein
VGRVAKTQNLSAFAAIIARHLFDASASALLFLESAASFSPLV